MVQVGKGRSFIWSKPQDCVTYGRGVMFTVHLVVDNQRSMLLSLCRLAPPYLYLVMKLVPVDSSYHYLKDYSWNMNRLVGQPRTVCSHYPLTIAVTKIFLLFPTNCFIQA